MTPPEKLAQSLARKLSGARYSSLCRYCASLAKALLRLIGEGQSRERQASRPNDCFLLKRRLLKRFIFTQIKFIHLLNTYTAAIVRDMPGAI